MSRRRSFQFMRLILLVTMIHLAPVGAADTPPPLAVITPANAAALEPLITLPADDPERLQFSQDSAMLYVGGVYGLEVVDIASQTITEFPIQVGLHGHAINSDETLLAVNLSSDLGGFQIYDLASGDLLAEVPCSGGSTRIAFSPTEPDLLALGVLSGLPAAFIDFWRVTDDLPTGWGSETIANCAPERRVEVSDLQDLSFTPDGRYLLNGSRLIDLERLEDSAPLEYSAALGDEDALIDVAAFDPAGDHVLLAGAETAIWAGPWDEDQREPYLSLEPALAELFDVAQISGAAFSPAGDLLAMTGGGILADGTLTGFFLLWDTATWTPLPLMRLPGDGAVETGIAFSPDGTLIAVGVWNLESLSVMLYGVVDRQKD